MAKLYLTIFAGMSLVIGLIWIAFHLQELDRQSCADKGYRAHTSPDSRSIRLVCVDSENRLVFLR